MYQGGSCNCGAGCVCPWACVSLGVGVVSGWLFCQFYTKMLHICANCSKFLQTSYEFCTQFLTTTFKLPVFEALCGRNSYEVRTNLVRTSYEFRTIFAGHWQKFHTNTTYACTEVPPHTHTHTHISLYLPPPPPAHTHTQTHTHTATHKHTHTVNESKQPPLDPHPHTARPRTLIRTWTVDVSR